MSRPSPAAARNGEAVSEDSLPASVVIANGGITNSKEFSALMSALMTDLLQGRVTAEVGNAVCNAGGKMLKAVEMSQRFGRPVDSTNGMPEKVIKLA
jgi:hypothetical protein